MRASKWKRTAALAFCAGTLALAAPATTSAEPLPASLAGSWRITRLLPTNNIGCWSTEQARALVGTTLTYSAEAMRWRDGEVRLGGIATREVSAAQFRKENTGSAGAADFEHLGIHSARVLEVDMQHEDMDVTGSTTEVPGDSVLVVAPNRIVVSACGVFMEATRSSAGSSLLRTSARR